MPSDTRAPMSKAKTAANAITVAVATILGIVGINIVMARFFARADLTEDKIYKLSDASLQAVRDLPDRMTVRAYISSGLQPPLNQYGRYIRDVLDEYASASKGKLRWEAIDPLEGSTDEKKQKQEDLQKYKIQKITLERISEAKLEIGSDNYLGIGFQYGGEIEAIPQITSTEGLEYQITSIIKKMVTAKKRKIGFVTSEGELQPSQGLQLVARVLADYDTTTVTLDKPIPDDVDVAVVVGPKQPFNDKAKYELDQYLMKGKPVALFLDGMVMEQPRGMNIPGMEQPKMGRANDVNLTDQLLKYGVKVNEDLILDEQNAQGPVPQGGQLYLENHPVFLAVTDKALPPKFPITDRLKVLILPFASSVELAGDLKEGKAGGVTATELAHSTKGTSWRQSGFFLFNADPRAVQKSGELGPFPLGYALEGKLKSAFPAGPPGSDPNMSTPDAAKAAKESPDKTRLVVVGDSDMLNDQNLQVIQHVPYYRANLLFFVNAIDWLLHDESLIALRAKGMAARPLTVTYDGKVKTWVAFNVVGIPLLLIAFGLALWQVRKARRSRYNVGN